MGLYVVRSDVLTDVLYSKSVIFTGLVCI